MIYYVIGADLCFCDKVILVTHSYSEAVNTARTHARRSGQDIKIECYYMQGQFAGAEYYFGQKED